MVTTRGTARKRAASATPRSATKKVKFTPGTKTAKRGQLSGKDFSDLAFKTRNNVNSTINQLTKLRNEAYTRTLRVLGNNLTREIQRRQGASKRKITPSPVAATVSKKPRTIKNLKSAMRKQGTAVSARTARKPRATPKTLARQTLTNEQFRNQITKILNTQKLSKDKLKTLKNNANQRNGMKNISNRINLLLNPRSTPKSAPKSAPAIMNKFPTKEDTLMYIYNKLQLNKTSRDAYAWAVLYTIMNKIFSTQLVNKMGASDIDQLFEDTKSHLSKSRTGNYRSHSKKLSDEELVDMLFLMYLDGVHDKYLNNVNFPQFLKTGYITEIITSNVLVFVSNYALSNKITPLFQTFYSLENVTPGVKKNIQSLYNGARNKSEGSWLSPGDKKPTKEIIGVSWEANFKKNIETLFPRQIKDVINVNSINKLLVSKAKGDYRIYTGIDQEAESEPISSIIETSMNAYGYFLYPYISLGVLLDPGNTMVRRMLKNDIAHILSNEPKIGLMYDVEPTLISFSWKDEPNFFVLDSGMIELPPISKKGSKELLGAPVLSVRINRNLVPIGASAGEARANEITKSKYSKFTKGFIEFGKFMGDGLQYMYLASKKTQKNPRAFCSGDGMACASYMFYSGLFGKTDPPLIVDGGATQGSKLTIYNIGEYVSLDSTRHRPRQVASNITNRGAVASRNSPNGNNVQSRPTMTPAQRTLYNKLSPKQRTVYNGMTPVQKNLLFRALR